MKKIFSLKTILASVAISVSMISASNFELATASLEDSFALSETKDIIETFVDIAFTKDLRCIKAYLSLHNELITPSFINKAISEIISKSNQEKLSPLPYLLTLLKTSYELKNAANAITILSRIIYLKPDLAMVNDIILLNNDTANAHLIFQALRMFSKMKIYVSLTTYYSFLVAAQKNKQHILATVMLNDALSSPTAWTTIPRLLKANQQKLINRESIEHYKQYLPKCFNKHLSLLIAMIKRSERADLDEDALLAATPQ
ncbi:hypothetical protein FJ365_04925 [Candidatus Dependentiae bacterium]|nr:hypothetical protein [Candidatus Dependentiae bacterium]